MGFSNDKAELFFVQYIPSFYWSRFSFRKVTNSFEETEEISLFPLYDTKQIILWSRIRTMPYTKITLMWIHLFDIPMTFIMCIKDETNDIISQSSSFFLIYKCISIILLLLLDLFHLYSDMHNQIDQVLNF